jgi:hypothetical protein
MVEILSKENVLAKNPSGNNSAILTRQICPKYIRCQHDLIFATLRQKNQ